MRLILDERENTLSITNDHDDIDTKARRDVYKISNVLMMKSLLVDVINSHILSEDGTIIEINRVTGEKEEIVIP